MIPFFVVDRPMSLNILKTSFAKQPKHQFGLLTHALVSRNFLNLFSRFPCVNNGECWLRANSSCGSSHLKDGALCPLGKTISGRTVKICDYGIFEEHAKRMSYAKLFRLYEEADADYGVMQDVLGDSKRTLLSASRALHEYGKQKWKFKLVLVAQGKSIDEYVWCYRRLRDMGARYIAIGGLLRRRPLSARYLYITNTQLEEVLQAIRVQCRPRWLFVLGAYHARRHEIMDRSGVYGSDYKGWIFQYEHRREMIRRLHAKLSNLEESIADGNLRRARTLRDDLAQREQRIRSRYIRTRNNSPTNSSLKSAIRKRLKTLHARLADVDQDLLNLRVTLMAERRLPPNYKRTVKQLASVIRQSDQAIRIAGVHKYLNKSVYR